MPKPAPLAFGPVAILHAIADGNRFGFDIMDATGLTSGTVYPALDKLVARLPLVALGRRANGAARQAPAAALFRSHRRRRHGARRRAAALQEPEARVAGRVEDPPQ